MEPFIMLVRDSSLISRENVQVGLQEMEFQWRFAPQGMV